ncbi:DUF4381 domain-containing protein [Chitinophagaceae bacterium LWZ2-11]
MDDFGQLIEPAPVPFSFNAPGWYVLAGLVIIAILLTCLFWYGHYKRNLYRKNALIWLQDKEQTLKENKVYDKLIYESNILMKRIAVKKYGRANVAGLRGVEWIDFLNKVWKEKSFSGDDLQIINRFIYSFTDTITDEQAEAFVEKTKRWIRKHKAFNK